MTNWLKAEEKERERVTVNKARQNNFKDVVVLDFGFELDKPRQ